MLSFISRKTTNKKMETSPFLEKRAFPRYTAKIPLTYFGSDSSKEFQVKTHDISAQGLCIITDRELIPGSALDIFLYMADNSGKIYRKGKAVWCKILENDLYRIGIKLEEPNLNPIPLVLKAIMPQREY